MLTRSFSFCRLCTAVLFHYNGGVCKAVVFDVEKYVRANDKPRQSRNHLLRIHVQQTIISSRARVPLDMFFTLPPLSSLGLPEGFGRLVNVDKPSRWGGA
ncbi:hypothetical protein EDD16DRAFT_1677550, partial [Pisolithus croceorrhizus]